MSVRADGYHTCSEQDALVLGREPSSGVTKHSHCHYGGESLGRVVPDVFFERQEPVEEEAQVAPILLGFQRGVPCGGGIPKVKGHVEICVALGEVEEFCLVMFQDEPCLCKHIEEALVCMVEMHAVFFDIARLDDDGTIVHVLLVGIGLGWVGMPTQYTDLLVPQGLSLSVCWLGVKPQAPGVSKSSIFRVS